MCSLYVIADAVLCSPESCATQGKVESADVVVEGKGSPTAGSQDGAVAVDMEAGKVRK